VQDADSPPPKASRCLLELAQEENSYSRFCRGPVLTRSTVRSILGVQEKRISKLEM